MEFTKLIKYLFRPYEDLLPKPPDEPEEVVEVKRELVVGEPVKSLSASILEMKDWVVEEGSRGLRYYKEVKFRHKHKELDVSFRMNYYPLPTSSTYSGCPEFICQMDWMTTDEKVFMGETFNEYFRLAQEEADRQRQIELAAEREKFMVLVK